MGNWSNASVLKYKAVEHTKEMSKRYAKEIKECIKNTKVYSEFRGLLQIATDDIMKVELVASGTTEAAQKYGFGKTAVLNFASFTNPGGKFIEGSSAQEECLCHESFLFNVLSAFDTEYYALNRMDKNRGLYSNRALYSPNVIFERDGEVFKCDVITCAAPYWGAARRNGVSIEENYKTVEERTRYVIEVAIDNEVDTLVLGAFGCGVFKQDPVFMAMAFIKAIKKYSTYEGIKISPFKKIVFAIPEETSANYTAFREVINSYNKELINNGN